jgi:hypothetical protein
MVGDNHDSDISIFVKNREVNCYPRPITGVVDTGGKFTAGVNDIRTGHIRDIVSGFLSSRPDWLPPPPHPEASVAPPPDSRWRGGDTLAAGEGAGGS